MVNFLFIDGLPLDFFNPRSIIVFICILQGAIFAALLFFRFLKNKQKADFWLGLLLVLLCSNLVTPLIGFANVYDRNQWLTFFPFAVFYSYGVCIWFYTLNLTDSKRRFKGKDLLLFIPSVVYLFFRFFLFAQSPEFKDWFDDNYYAPIFSPLFFISELIWNLSFLYLSIRHYKKYRAWLDENYSDTEKIKFDWLKNFLYVFTFVLMLGALFDFANNFVFNLSYIQYFYFEFILALATYYLAIAGYLRSQTIELEFSGTKGKEIEEGRKIPVSDTEKDKLKNKISDLMQTEKPYLEPSLTLNDLAKKLGVNSAALSYAINSGFGKNFNDFINEFRIAEVKEKLISGAAENKTLLAVAFDCGFNSKATFNRAFKKFTGVSPKEFQDKISGS